MTNFISPDLEHLDLEKFMREALAEADAAGQAGELPIGAVLALDNEIIARGRARHNEYKSQGSCAAPTVATCAGSAFAGLSS